MQINLSSKDVEQWLKQKHPTIAMGSAHLEIISEYAAEKINQALSEVRLEIGRMLIKFPPPEK